MHTTHKHPHTSTGRKLMRYIRKLGRSVQILYMIFTTVAVVPITHELETGNTYTIPELSIQLILILILILIVSILGYWQVQYNT